MRKSPFPGIAALFGICSSAILSASPSIMEQHCFECHNDEKSKGKFELTFLGDSPTSETLDYWLDSLDMVSAEEMPPEEDSELSSEEREQLVSYFEQKLSDYEKSSTHVTEIKPRRLNNREFANSVRDVLKIEDIGTNQPLANLVGDTLHHGFDTHSDTLGLSLFHLEQYIEAVRKIVDANILSGDRPKTKRYEIDAEGIFRSSLKQNTTRRRKRPLEEGAFDFLDPRLHAYFRDFKKAPTSGNYRIKIRATGKDHHVYDTKYTGLHKDDPIQLSVHMGDRIRTFDLPDEEIMEISLDEWLAAGTRIELHNPTDGFTLRGNSNFKFQYRIVADHLKKNDPQRYRKIVAQINGGTHETELQSGRNQPGRGGNRKQLKNPDRWQNWLAYWEGARPRLFSAEIEGPIYDAWPPKRQIALLGENPKATDAAAILEPIAERAWRRPVRDGELDDIVSLVQSKAETLDDVEALKEGLVAILVSSAFLILNTEGGSPTERFASKFNYFLESTLPDQELRRASSMGLLDDFESVRDAVEMKISQSQAEPFIREFPYQWMELNDINFMSPDPAQYPFYNRKKLSQDMIGEARHFFRHVVENNLPITEFLSADYSFINADLAELYGVESHPDESKFHKHTFTDGRRGGLLGMGAFLTSTADSLSTSPIHRAIYVMENFMGIHPSAPPADIEINEPDVRQAKTIKEILAKHMTEESCAICHENIDPYGYAFENFDPTGAWRDVYVAPDENAPSDEDFDPSVSNRERIQRISKHLVSIPIDPSSKFINGTEYQDITEFRKLILRPANRKRFVRCFINKLLTYANGVEPTDADFAELNKIIKRSRKNDYRIVDTIAAVIDSPLFRQNNP